VPAKAIAVASDTEGRWAYGLSSDLTKLDEAEARALAECRQRVERFEVDAECTVRESEGPR
jgi:hypothetical protein